MVINYTYKSWDDPPSKGKVSQTLDGEISKLFPASTGFLNRIHGAGIYTTEFTIQIA